MYYIALCLDHRGVTLVVGKDDGKILNTVTMSLEEQQQSSRLIILVWQKLCQVRGSSLANVNKIYT